MIKKKRRKKILVFFGTLINREGEYVEIIAKNLDRANTLMDEEYGDRVDFVYKANRFSENHYSNKIETLREEDSDMFNLSSFTGDQKLN